MCFTWLMPCPHEPPNDTRRPDPAPPGGALLALTPGAPAPHAAFRPLTADDGPRLRRHFQTLADALPDAQALLGAPLRDAPGARPDAPAAALLEALSLDTAADLAGAAACVRGEIVALALLLDDGPDGLGTAMTALPGWRSARTDGLLGQVLADAAPRPPLPEARQLSLAGLCCLLGGRLVRGDRLSAEPAPTDPRRESQG